ncbi:MAG: hypothetical protein WCY19_07150 [Candidatus Gastranaerophilaceae bacterium]
MKRVLILCLFLILGETIGECAVTFFPPLQPVPGPAEINNYGENLTSLNTPLARSPKVNYPDIERVENSLFGRIFANQNISLRLSRIEKSLFTTTYPGSTISQRIDNIISNFNQINKNPNISQGELSRLESKVFRQNFPQNNPQRRIERLEQQVFGAVQSGDLGQRYEALKTASATYRNNTQNSLSGNGWQGIIGSLGGSPLGGTMTGFTPPINPYYNNYNNGYNNGYNNNNQYPNGYGMYRGYRSNHGYLDDFQNFSSGTGVTILD